MNSVIIAGAGVGKRTGLGFNKILYKVAGVPILVRTVLKFAALEAISEIIVVVGADDLREVELMLKAVPGLKNYKLVEGGKERQDSVRNGLAAVNPFSEIVLIHDAARPFVSESVIMETIEAAKVHGAAIAAVPAKNTVKVTDTAGFITATPERATIYEAQTPQTFQLGVILAAYEKARQDGVIGTDDAMLVERLGEKVKIVESEYSNIKITTPEDLGIAEFFAIENPRERLQAGATKAIDTVFDLADKIKNKITGKPEF